MKKTTKKLRPNVKDFRKILVVKEGIKLKAYALYVKEGAVRYHINLPKLPIPIRNNIKQLWVEPSIKKESLPVEPKDLIHGRTAFLESGIHSYSLKNNILDYFGIANKGDTYFYFILKDQ